MHVEAGADEVFAQDEAEVACEDAEPCCKTLCKAPPPRESACRRLVAAATTCLIGGRDTPTHPNPVPLIGDGEDNARNKAP